VWRHMFIGVSAFLVALGHGQPADYGEDANGLGDSDDAGGVGARAAAGADVRAGRSPSRRRSGRPVS
jgi:hypothetical protein